MRRIAFVVFLLLSLHGHDTLARQNQLIAADPSADEDPCDDIKYGKDDTGQEKDHKLLTCEQKREKRFDHDRESLEKQLKAIQKEPDPGRLTGDAQFENSNHDCYSGCQPSSLGGQCPDMIFKYMDPSLQASAPAAPPAQSAAPGSTAAPVTAPAAGNKMDQGKFDAYYAAHFDDSAKKNLCDGVEQTLRRLPMSVGQGTASCQAEIKKCRFNARDAKIAELKELIDKDKQASREIDDNLEDVKDRLSNGCADCGSSYYSNGPTGMQKFAMIMSALTPTIGAGLNTWLNLKNINAYTKSYSNYLAQCTTIGVPCTSPPGVVPLGYGGSGYGYGSSGLYSGIGGLSGFGGGLYSGVGMYSGGGIYSGIGGIYGGAGLYSGAGLYGSGGLYGSSLYGGMSMGYPAMSFPALSPLGGGGLYGTAGLYGASSLYGTSGIGAMGVYGSYVGTYGSASVGSYTGVGTYTGIGTYTGVGTYTGIGGTYVGSSLYSSIGSYTSTPFSPYGTSAYGTSAYGTSAYGTGYGLGTYAGIGGSSQYSALYAQSLALASSSQTSQNIMTAEQAAYASQARYLATLQQSSSYGSSSYNPYASFYSPYASSYGSSSYGSGYGIYGLNLSI